MNCLRHELQRCCMIWLRHDLPCGALSKMAIQIMEQSEKSCDSNS